MSLLAGEVGNCHCGGAYQPNMFLFFAHIANVSAYLSVFLKILVKRSSCNLFWMLPDGN